MTSRAIPLLSACTFAAVLLTGCVSLLPKQTPVQLYRFGATDVERGGDAAAPPPRTVGRGQDTLGVVLTQVSMPRAAEGDELLTTRGDAAAYIAEARWVAPAAVMFQESARRAFADRAARVRLIGRSDVAAASALLRLDVTEFDTRYNRATDATPQVVVSLRATLASADGRRLLQQGFTASQPAAQDRVSAIVAAYDAAVQAVLGQVVGWTDVNAPGLASALDPAAPTTLLPRHAVRGLPAELHEQGSSNE